MLFCKGMVVWRKNRALNFDLIIKHGQFELGCDDWKHVSSKEVVSKYHMYMSSNVASYISQNNTHIEFGISANGLESTGNTNRQVQYRHLSTNLNDTS